MQMRHYVVDPAFRGLHDFGHDVVAGVMQINQAGWYLVRLVFVRGKAHGKDAGQVFAWNDLGEIPTERPVCSSKVVNLRRKEEEEEMRGREYVFVCVSASEIGGS